ncbi:Inositol 2-dehydrogenase/D-chiro-inositol 3-dehydrogenase [Alphaproteobacteria bacterium SO-S41]|nr:Inositol 2-dehydrogenase/D-chiro-inositol 3-dehydrogenase [Alphaproteobacteria bacterium SO-S41]
MQILYAKRSMNRAPDPNKPLRAAVVGAGVFGRFHAAKYKALPGVELVGIVDRSSDAAVAAAKDLGCQPFVDTYGLAGEIDIVTVATPAVAHAAAVVRLLEEGVHAYVEKPIAASLAEADRIVAAAEGNGRVLQVGHQERFVFAHMGLLNRKSPPLRIECHRAGPWSGRGTDVNVALDLMVHDIDLVHQIAPGEATIISATTRSRPDSYGDEVSAHLAMAGGCRVDLFASRIAEARKRFMRLEYADGSIFVDFMARTIENTTSEPLTTIFGEGAGGVAADPLGYAVGDFVRCVREGAQPLITGRDGRRALATTLAILEAGASPATRDEALAA